MSESALLAEARELDSKDPLSLFRDQFVIEDDSQIYLNGNSLGRLPKRTADVLRKVIDHEWGGDLIKSWNKSWYTKPAEIGNKIGAIIGADQGEVIVSDNTSTNLYKLVYAALNIQNQRKKIVTDRFNFPSDLYILDGINRQLQNKHQIEFAASEGDISVQPDQFLQLLDEGTALLTLSHATFKSSYLYDIKKITDIAHEVGALVLWDLSHSVGVVPIELKKWGVDLAVGCTYKYLNGGPGAPAFLYVRKDLQERFNTPLQGWFGAENPFDFDLDYVPAKGINRFLSGTPSVLSLIGIESGVDLILEAGVENIRKKSTQMSTYFIELIERELLHSGFQLASPKEVKNRGSHISLRHSEAFRINKALEDNTVEGCAVIADFRAPDNLRFGFSPLYNTFTDVFLTVSKLKKIITGRIYENYDFSKPIVT